MILINTLKILLRLELAVRGNSRVFVCAKGDEDLQFIIDWPEGFSLTHVVAANELNSLEEEIFVLYLIDMCNKAYREAIEKRSKPL